VNYTNYSNENIGLRGKKISFLNLFFLLISNFKELQLLNSKLDEFKKPKQTEFWQTKVDIDDNHIKNVCNCGLQFFKI
jgi:hypothetical protein